MSSELKPTPRLLRNPVHLLSLGFGSGLSPWAPGTAGTLVGVILFLPMTLLERPVCVGVTAVMFLCGISLCGRTSAALGAHDPQAIVWDEITGYFTAMVLAPAGWPWLTAGFVLFRIFDITKPWPIRWLDRNVGGGLGIMLDDLAAGLFSAIIMQIIAYLL